MSYPLASIISSRKDNPYYDVLLYWAPTKACNLRCVYCWDQKEKTEYEITEIDCQSLKRVLDKSDKIFLFSFTGGEPFLIPNILDVFTEVTKRHFMRFNSNFISGDVSGFAERIDPKRVWDIEASCHIKELERRNLLNRYIHNYQLCKDKGFPIVAVEVAHPSLLGEAEKYKAFFKTKGIDLFFTQFCGTYNGKEYPPSYTSEELKVFGLENDLDRRMYYSKGKLCNAGYNVAVLNSDWNVTTCFLVQEDLGNFCDKINFRKELIECPVNKCGCPFNCYHTYLFARALSECGKNQIISPPRSS